MRFSGGADASRRPRLRAAGSSPKSSSISRASASRRADASTAAVSSRSSASSFITRCAAFGIVPEVLRRASARRVRLCAAAWQRRQRRSLSASRRSSRRAADVACVSLMQKLVYPPPPSPLVAHVPRRDRVAASTTEVHYVRSAARGPARAQFARLAAGKCGGRRARSFSGSGPIPPAITSRASFHRGSKWRRGLRQLRKLRLRCKPSSGRSWDCCSSSCRCCNR